MLTIMFLLAVIAFLLTIASATGRVALWIPVLFLTIMELLRVLPLGK